MTERTMSKIPIRNVYHMLAYVWDFPLSIQEQKFSKEAFTHIENLFGHLFATHVSTLVMRGLAKNYVDIVETSQVLKGKLLFTQAHNQNSFRTKSIPCQFDELTENIMLNQIVKATLYRLLQFPSLHQSIRERLLLLRKYFVHIEDIDGSMVDYNLISLNRLNRHYGIVLHMSKLIFEQQNVSGQGGEHAFNLLHDEAKMYDLYEKFLQRFYKKHLPQLKVYSPKINWKLSGDEKQYDLQLLPEMQTDLVIESKDSQLIIDAKFYKDTLAINRFGQSKIHSDNLYQLLSYVTNSQFEGEISGLLLYPRVHQTVDVKYTIQGHSIYVKTIDLNQEWERVERDLLGDIGRDIGTVLSSQ